MMIDIRMPRLSDTMESGRIVQWLKSEGSAVAPGEPLCEVETDKAVVEIPCHCSGILESIVVGAGEEAAVGATIAVVRSDSR